MGVTKLQQTVVEINSGNTLLNGKTLEQRIDEYNKRLFKNGVFNQAEYADILDSCVDLEQRGSPDIKKFLVITSVILAIANSYVGVTIPKEQTEIIRLLFNIISNSRPSIDKVDRKDPIALQKIAMLIIIESIPSLQKIVGMENTALFKRYLMEQ